MTKPVILFQDGAIDELMSVALLTTMPTDQIEYLGCFVVSGDCLTWPTIQVQKKILNLINSFNPRMPTDTFVIPVGCRGVNAFPWTYRQYSMMANLLPALNVVALAAPDEPPDPARPEVHRAAAAERVADILAATGEQLTLLSLGPLTPIADLISALGPALVDRVEEIVWMGGAIPPESGNVDTGIAIGANPNAEWNAYWDPYAVEAVFESGIPIRLFPLNVTNDFALDATFFEDYIYPHRNDPMIDLAGQMYSTVAFEAGYCFWDTVTTAYLGLPELFDFETERLTINTDFTSPEFGSITPSRDGTLINVATIPEEHRTERVQAFYAYLVRQLQKVCHD